MSFRGKSAPTILAPTDFSECSEPAVARALELGRALGGSVVLLHVIDATPFIVAPDTPLMWAPYVEEMRTGSEARLRELANRLGVPRFEVVDGRAAPAIIQSAERLHADMIVLGTHGRSGFSRLFMGSTAERVVRTAPCDVLVVRAGSEKKPEPERPDGEP